jgi:putative copper resistance protein D
MDAQGLISMALRALGLVAIFQAAGIALFLAVFGRGLTATIPAVRRYGVIAATAAIVFVLLHQFLEPARMSGTFHSIFDGSLQELAWTIPSGAASVLRLMGLLALCVGLTGSFRFSAAARLLGVAITVASFVLAGHTVELTPRAAFAALLVVHLLIVAFWFGSLTPLYAATTRESVSGTAMLVERFSAIATWIVPGIFVAGMVLALVLLPNLASWRSAYASMILTKIAAFAALMGLAALNKWRLGPAISQGDVRALRKLQTAVAIEWGLIVAVLIATATLTTYFSPPDA